MTDKETNAAEAWLILNEKDPVQQKILDLLQDLFSDRNPNGFHNREMFMQIMGRTEAVRQAIHNATMGAGIQTLVADAVKRTLETAEVLIQDNITTYKPQIAVRFTPMYGGSFTVYPRVSRL